MQDVKAQYKNPKHLNTRISIHSKYSTNKTPYFDWIASHYAFAPGDRVLELGCGTGELWKTNLNLLKDGVSLTMTDFSRGMWESAQASLPEHPSICYNTVDIQDIPYEDNSFDAVIANMMLHHVPDVAKGLAEVRRVLKPGGTFYCAAFGEKGIHEYTAALLRELDIPDKSMNGFTKQNGAAQLAPYFASVTWINREDGLEITNIQDFADYMYSLSSLSNVDNLPREVLLQKLEIRMVNGILYVPKEYGMFVCK